MRSSDQRGPKRVAEIRSSIKFAVSIEVSIRRLRYSSNYSLINPTMFCLKVKPHSC